MAEIIRPGKKPGDNLRGCWQCPQCGCEFRLSREDAGAFARADNDGLRGDGGEYVKGHCPDCGHYTRPHRRIACPTAGYGAIISTEHGRQDSREMR